MEVQEFCDAFTRVSEPVEVVWCEACHRYEDAFEPCPNLDNPVTYALDEMGLR